MAFALATAAISLAEALEDNTLVQTVFATYKILKEKIEEFEGKRLESRVAQYFSTNSHHFPPATVSQVVEQLLPCLHGLSRAVVHTPATWPQSAVNHLSDILEPLSSASVSTISSISRGSFINSSSDGRFVLSVLARYEMSNSPFSANFVTKCDSEMCQAVLLSVVAGIRLTPEQSWEQITSGTVKTASTLSLDGARLASLTTYARQTLASSLEALRDLEDEQDSVLEGTDIYELLTVSNCLVSLMQCSYGQILSAKASVHRKLLQLYVWSIYTRPSISLHWRRSSRKRRLFMTVAYR